MEVTVSMLVIALIAAGLVGAFLLGRRYEKAKLLKNNNLDYRLARARAQLVAAEKQIVRLRKRRDKLEFNSIHGATADGRREATTQHTQTDKELAVLTCSLPSLQSEISRLEGEQQLADIAK